MKVSTAIKKLQRIQKKVGDVQVFFQDDYDRVTEIGHVSLKKADDRHIEWNEKLKEGDVLVEFQV